MTSPFDPPREEMGSERESGSARGYPGRRVFAWAVDMTTVFLCATLLPLVLQLILLHEGTTLGTRLAGLAPTGSAGRRRIRCALSLFVGLIGAVGGLWVILGVSDPVEFAGVELVGAPMILLASVNTLPLWASGSTFVDLSLGVRLERRPLFDSSTPAEHWSPPSQHDPFAGVLGTQGHQVPTFEEPPDDHVMWMDPEDREDE